MLIAVARLDHLPAKLASLPDDVNANANATFIILSTFHMGISICLIAAAGTPIP